MSTDDTSSFSDNPGPNPDPAEAKPHSAKSLKRQEIVEQIEVAGDQLVSKVKELVAEGSAKRIVLRSSEGKELFSLPLNVGVAAGGVVTLAAPLLAAIGAVAALVTKVQLEIVRIDHGPADEPPGPVPPASGSFNI